MKKKTHTQKSNKFSKLKTIFVNNTTIRITNLRKKHVKSLNEKQKSALSECEIKIKKSIK